MIEQAHLQAIESRISHYERQLASATSDRLKRTISGLLWTEKMRLMQWQRLFEIRQHDGE